MECVYGTVLYQIVNFFVLNFRETLLEMLYNLGSLDFYDIGQSNTVLNTMKKCHNQCHKMNVS